MNMREAELAESLLKVVESDTAICFVERESADVTHSERLLIDRQIQVGREYAMIIKQRIELRSNKG